MNNGKNNDPVSSSKKTAPSHLQYTKPEFQPNTQSFKPPSPHDQLKTPEVQKYRPQSVNKTPGHSYIHHAAQAGNQAKPLNYQPPYQHSPPSQATVMNRLPWQQSPDKTASITIEVVNEAHSKPQTKLQ